MGVSTQCARLPFLKECLFFIDLVPFFFFCEQEGDHVLTRQRKVKITHRDKFLRKFMYKEALNAALKSTDVKVTALFPSITFYQNRKFDN